METLPFDSELVSMGIFRSIEMKLKFIYTTFNQYDDAIKVKEHLVSSNLAICVNLFKEVESLYQDDQEIIRSCLLYTSPSPRDRSVSRMPSSA